MEISRIEFSLNDCVWVKLSEVGAKAFVEVFGRGSPRVSPLLSPTDRYTKWVLWQLMEVFGPTMNCGHGNPFVGNIIYSVEHPE
jgi:hypothetical protein